MAAIGACDPTSEDFMNIAVLSPLAEHYNIDLSDLRAQGRSVQAIVADYVNKDDMTTVKDIKDVMKTLLPVRAGFSTVLRVLQIALTIPVATAQCERSFSVMKRIKSYLRATTSQERLRDVSLLATERELSSIDAIDWDRCINIFAKSDRRMPLK